MTAETEIANITLVHGSISVEIQTARVQEILNKQLVIIKPTQGSSNYGAGPISVKIIDLLRIVETFFVQGHIAKSDKTNFKNIMKAGGVASFTWDSVAYTANISKMTIENDGESVNDEREVQFTLDVGVNV